MDLVYIVRAGENDELRWSLRSAAVHLAHERVWVVGGGPGWLTGVERIPNRDSPRKRIAALAGLLAACRHPGISDEFVLMNDDFYVTEPIASVPALHIGDLNKTITQIPPGSARHRGLAETARVLVRRGVQDALCYEGHYPLVVHKGGMCDALMAAGHSDLIHPRTVYGNVAKIGGTLTSDCKVRDSQSSLPGGPFASTSDETFAHGLVGQQLREMFPVPSRYERGAA